MKIVIDNPGTAGEAQVGLRARVKQVAMLFIKLCQIHFASEK